MLIFIIIFFNFITFNIYVLTRNHKTR